LYNPLHSEFVLSVRLERFDIDDPALSLYEDGNISIDPLLYLATPNSQIIVAKETPDERQGKD
jgi:hypothetical protein